MLSILKFKTHFEDIPPLVLIISKINLSAANCYINLTSYDFWYWQLLDHKFHTCISFPHEHASDAWSKNSKCHCLVIKKQLTRVVIPKRKVVLDKGINNWPYIYSISSKVCVLRIFKRLYNVQSYKNCWCTVYINSKSANM